MRSIRVSRTGLFGLVAAASALVLAACSPGVSPEELAAKEQEISRLQGQLSTLEQDAKFWQQLTGLLEPVPLATMTDHRAFMLPGGSVIALHFDDMDLDQAENLNWVALGIPGTFCATDQERVVQEFGGGEPIFTHFHDLENDVHGGEPGAEGVWFVHTAVRDFEAPWGQVSPGPDTGFMPTAAPDC